MARDPLETLREQPCPPESLERRVVAAVRTAGAIGPRAASRRWWLSAAAVVLFASGVTAGRLWPGVGENAPAPPVTSSYLLLLEGDVTPSADRGSRAAEYGAWATTVADRGVGIRGAELADGGQVVNSDAAAEPPTALREVTGYFIVNAASEVEAVSLAQSSPHVKYGGTVVVKKILPVNR
jgi:hypothetical protein